MWTIKHRLMDEESGDDGGDAPGGGDGDAQSSPSFPEDWRELIAGDDEKSLKQLGRYATPADVWTKTRSLEQMISSGEYRKATPFPAEGTPEEQSAWRKDNGIPEAPDKYDLDVEDDDRDRINPFLEFAHAKNFSPDQVKDMVGFFYDKASGDAAATEEMDKQHQQATEDALRAEWGGEFRAHSNRVESFLNTMPESVRDEFMDARLPSGALIRNSPDVQKFLLNSFLEINPEATVIPDVGNDVGSIQDQIDEIETLMRTDRKAYNADEKLKEKYRALLTKQMKISAA